MTIKPELTEDRVLGGRLRLRQPGRGHRVGHDAILLAAACPARPGERVIDLGAGVGAAGLALAARIPGTEVTLVEIDPQLAALAEQNARLNGLDQRVRAITLDVAAPARAFAAAGLVGECAAHVMMNPPFNDPERQRASPEAARRFAHVAPQRMTLTTWVRTATRLLRARGRLTLIWRADGLANVLAVLAQGLGAIAITPVYPRPGRPAIRILVNATKGTHAPHSLLPGLVLADALGRPTEAAEAILRGGAPLRSSVGEP